MKILKDLSLTCESMVILACSEMFVAVFSSRIAFGLIMSIVCLSFDNSHIFAVSLATSSVLRACLETHLSIMKRFNSMLAMAI